MKNKKKNVGGSVLLVLSAAALWGTAGIFVRGLSGEFGEMQIVLLRALLSAGILGVMILLRDRSLFLVKPRDLVWFAALGIFSIVFFNFFYYKTMALTSLSVAAVLLYTAPFFVVFLSAVIFREPLTVRKIFACIAAFFGCCMVTGVFGGGERVSPKAFLFGLLTGLGYGLYTVFGEILLRKGYTVLTITFYAFLFALLGSLPFADPATMAGSATPRGILLVSGMAVFNTVLPYLLYTNGLKGVSASTAPIMANLEPVVATLIGAFLFSEPITAAGVLGIGLVLFAVVLLNRKPTRKTLRAYAKINLALCVLEKREDGYHSVDTVMQRVNLFDQITIKKQGQISVESPIGQEDITLAAARLFFESAGIAGGARITVKKRIPVCAGLGGGSSDAAAVLSGLNELYGAPLSGEELSGLALRLGADVPFFLCSGAARATGIGERLTPCKPLKNCRVLIARQGNKSSTGEMYRLLDSAPRRGKSAQGVVSALEQGDYEALCRSVFNSFEAVCDCGGTRDLLLELGADAAAVSGSGPSVFGLFSNAKTAKSAYRELKAKGMECYNTKPIA